MDYDYFYDLYLFYSILVDVIPTTTASPPPPEPSMTTTSQSTPATTTSADAPGTTTLPPPVSISVAPITIIGTNTAGESYSLECSITVAGSTDQPTITWLDPMNNQITSGVVETTGSISTLTFDPLAASHDGMTYTCRATLGSAMDSASWTVSVQGK